MGKKAQNKKTKATATGVGSNTSVEQDPLVLIKKRAEEWLRNRKGTVRVVVDVLKGNRKEDHPYDRKPLIVQCVTANVKHGRRVTLYHGRDSISFEL